MEQISAFFSRVLAAISLSGLTTFVTQYTNLLHVPYLTHGDWADSINESGRPFAVIGALAAFIVFYGFKNVVLRIASLALLFLSLILMATCCYYSDTIDNISDPRAAQAAILHWKWFYLAACVSLVVAATVASLWMIGLHSSSKLSGKEQGSTAGNTVAASGVQDSSTGDV